MTLEFHRELHSENGPVFLKLTHLEPKTMTEIERVSEEARRNYIVEDVILL